MFGIDNIKIRDVRKAMEDKDWRDKLGQSYDPHNWLISFCTLCALTANRKMTYVNLTNYLVMMGPLEHDPECWVPENYDYFIYTCLRTLKLASKVRRVLLDDLRSGDEEYGNIVLKSYARKLVDWLS